MALGASLLEDVAATIQVSSDGDGIPDASVTWGSAVTISLDDLNPTRELNTADHSSGQDLDEWHRTTKRGGTADFGIKWGPQGAGGVTPPSLSAGKRVKIVAVTTVAGVLFETTTIRGLLTSDARAYAGPSTCKITLKPCGGVPLISTT